MKEGCDTIRAFIAVDISDEVIGEIMNAVNALKKNHNYIRWVKEGGIHLTLKFLGEIDTRRVDAICDALSSVGSEFGAISLAAGQPGAFPNEKRPKVIWLGLEDEAGAISELQKRVEKSCAALGFPDEKKLFKPHLTLGRVKRGKVRWHEMDISVIMSSLGKVKTPPFEVGAFHLYRSELKPGGAIYTKLKSFPFRGDNEEEVIKG